MYYLHNQNTNLKNPTQVYYRQPRWRRAGSIHGAPQVQGSWSSHLMKHKINQLDLQTGLECMERGPPGTSPRQLQQPGQCKLLPRRAGRARRRTRNSGWCGFAATNACDLDGSHQVSRPCIPFSVKLEAGLEEHKGHSQPGTMS